MKAYFIQLTNGIFEKQQILLSGAVLAEDKEEAERKAIKIASKYDAVRALGAVLSIYTLIELSDERFAQFSVERRN